MAWNLSGRGLEICSCKTFCPCWLTADVEPDEGWCSPWRSLALRRWDGYVPAPPNLSGETATNRQCGSLDLV